MNKCVCVRIFLFEWVWLINLDMYAHNVLNKGWTWKEKNKVNKLYNYVFCMTKTYHT